MPTYKSYEFEFRGYFTVIAAEDKEEAENKFKEYFDEEFGEIEVDQIISITEVK